MWPEIQAIFRKYWRPTAIVGGISAAVLVGVYLQVDAKLLALLALIAGFVTNGFAALGALVVVVPVVGPLLVKLFSIPVFYMLNSVGYLLSTLATKKGYRLGALNRRMLTVILLAGVVIGYVLGNLVPLR